jgi:hypothetical protein
MDASVVTIELPNKLYADLQSLTQQAQAENPVDMIARLVTQAQHPAGIVYAATPAFQRILERAADLGIDDLSEQHDHYLVKAAADRG